VVKDRPLLKMSALFGREKKNALSLIKENQNTERERESFVEAEKYVSSTPLLPSPSPGNQRERKTARKSERERERERVKQRKMIGGNECNDRKIYLFSQQKKKKKKKTDNNKTLIAAPIVFFFFFVCSYCFSFTNTELSLSLSISQPKIEA
jgi:hypothetical protein